MSFRERPIQTDKIHRSPVQAHEHFSSEYVSAREKFLVAAGQQGWTLAQYPLENYATASDVPLTCDVAISPQPDANCALIVSSGLHGVEGFFGSAVQHAWLKCYQPTAERQPIRMVLVHALNPYGFAMLRRCDAENIDVNRNFILEPSAYRGHHPLYERLDSLLNPRRPPSRSEMFWAKSVIPISRFGFSRLSHAIAEGQYDFPKGLFFGGHQPSWTRELLEQNLAKWIGDSTRILHIDFHTGLGKWSRHQLLLDYTPSEIQRIWLQQHLGRHRPLELASRGAAYATRGGLGAWCQHEFGTRQYIYACAEFGTFSQLKILAALRRENQAHHWGAANDLRTQRAKSQLKDAFCPLSDGWRQAALQGALDIIADAVERIESLPQVY